MIMYLPSLKWFKSEILKLLHTEAYTTQKRVCHFNSNITVYKVQLDLINSVSIFSFHIDMQHSQLDKSA
jgi:hypothetical protein